MKTRDGFVSNSSSASYIVRLENINFEDFVRILMPEFGWSYFNVESLKTQLEETKKRIEGWRDEDIQYANDNAGDDDGWAEMRTLHVAPLAKVNSLIDKLSNTAKDDMIGLAKIVLDSNQIDLRATDNYVELSSFTSMHNDFDSGMSEIMKEIVLFLTFDTDYTVKCRRESDQ